MFKTFCLVIVILTALCLLLQEGIVDKMSAPSVSSISRILRGGRRDDDPRKDHSIDGILGKYLHYFLRLFKLAQNSQTITPH